MAMPEKIREWKAIQIARCPHFICVQLIYKVIFLQFN